MTPAPPGAEATTNSPGKGGGHTALLFPEFMRLYPVALIEVIQVLVGDPVGRPLLGEHLSAPLRKKRVNYLYERILVLALHGQFFRRETQGGAPPCRRYIFDRHSVEYRVAFKEQFWVAAGFSLRLHRRDACVTS